MTLIGLVTTCQLLIAGEPRALCGRQHLILCLATTAERSNKITSVYCLTQIPTSGVTTLALLAGSRNTTATRSQLSIRAGRDCVRGRCNMIPCLPNSIFDFRLAVTMPKLNFELRP